MRTIDRRAAASREAVGQSSGCVEISNGRRKVTRDAYLRRRVRLHPGTPIGVFHRRAAGRGVYPTASEEAVVSGELRRTLARDDTRAHRWMLTARSLSHRSSRRLQRRRSGDEPWRPDPESRPGLLCRPRRRVDRGSGATLRRIGKTNARRPNTCCTSSPPTGTPATSSAGPATSTRAWAEHPAGAGSPLVRAAVNAGVHVELVATITGVGASAGTAHARLRLTRVEVSDVQAFRWPARRAGSSADCHRSQRRNETTAVRRLARSPAADPRALVDEAGQARFGAPQASPGPEKLKVRAEGSNANPLPNSSGASATGPSASTGQRQSRSARP